MSVKISAKLNGVKLDWIVILKGESIKSVETEYGVTYHPTDATGQTPQTVLMTMADDFRNDPEEIEFIQPEMAAQIKAHGIELKNVKAIIEQQYA